MSRFEIGRTYTHVYDGSTVVCRRHWWRGVVEYVEFQLPSIATADGLVIEGERFVRTAHAMAGLYRPPVTETDGGVLRRIS